MAKDKNKKTKQVSTLTHDTSSRRNIPTAELQTVAERVEQSQPFDSMRFVRRYPLAEEVSNPRNPDLDPQLIWAKGQITLTPDQLMEAAKNGGRLEMDEVQFAWRGKDKQDQTDLIVPAPPLYIQEKIHPKAIIDDLKRVSKVRSDAAEDSVDLFADFNGIEGGEATEFYQHDQNWSNRMILGDSLQAMASLAERESMAGKVQCVYFDPPYGVKFNSNWQVSTQSRDVRDGKADSAAREPEVIKAFRDTWNDGLHSYLGYIRDRLVAMRELLKEDGSIFLQIGDENAHLVRAVMDEIFGAENYIRQIFFSKTGSLFANFIGRTGDMILWYAKDKNKCKFRPIFEEKGHDVFYNNIENEDYTYRKISKEELHLSASQIQGKIFRNVSLESSGKANTDTPFEFEGEIYRPNANRHWQVTYPEGMDRVVLSGRIFKQGNKLGYRLYIDDYPLRRIGDVWTDTSGFSGDQRYVVETRPKVVQRCILMATDPGDLVLDPTCGSGTTATVAEQWGRRWITMDTSRVALALARARIMAAKYPFYLLADSPDGRDKEQELSGKIQDDQPTQGDIRQGFVYERAPHITLKSIANNAEIDVIWQNAQPNMDRLRAELNTALGTQWFDWDIPRDADKDWDEGAKQTHAAWWQARIDRQAAIDGSIARNAGVEKLFDRAVENKTKVRVAGPFTVEALTPHRALAEDEDPLDAPAKPSEGNTDFTTAILDNLRTAGVQQGAKEDRIMLDSVTPWPGRYISAKGGCMFNGKSSTAGIFVGPEFGAVSRVDLTTAAREAIEAGCDVLIACGFNFDVQVSDVDKMGDFHIIKAKMNPDLHMAGDLKNTGSGNMFVVFGEPDISPPKFDEDGNITISVNGVDVFDPKSGEVRSDGRDGIAAWFIDTDYNQESFFVRHAYFLGANDPYKALKTTLKADIDEEAWATLNRAESRPFPRPSSGRFAVKVINHFGDEVMKVFEV